MLQFQCDYLQGCAPEILRRLENTNSQCFVGYGEDPVSASAIAKIRSFVGSDDADVWFVTGGTQANQLVIDAMLQPYEGVVSTTAGHVNVHESGAIEFTGHKVMTLPAHDGKMCAGELKKMMQTFYADGTYEHQVFPGMVYISHPTEYGTLYTKDELTALSQVCREYHLPLYVDGARLGYGLASRHTDVTVRDLYQLVDAFYIGGTKCGSLFGEAIVFTKNNTPRRFFTRRKQHGALLAKGWLLGIQFDELFTDGLYMKLAANAIDQAEYMKKEIAAKGYDFLLDSPTNQQFVILDNEKMHQLEKDVIFSVWEPVDETHTAVRFATSWATTKDQVDQLLALL
ncbi:MAG: aminotransferase class I/II-fold pyridoxal phosphate-dependent enzyme [Firmicutes bacterium]|nr:aminotransferase class I/II-fold pyridoxal phosphate-dependent enzyme [Bacillota bacterium]